MLVAPNGSDGNNTVSVWLPAGGWYDFWTDTKHAGGTTENIQANTGDIPVFVKEGAIIPMAEYALSTYFIAKDVLILHVYTGADGTFSLYEDDGVTEKFRTKDESMLTQLGLTQADLGLTVGAAEGTYDGAPTARSYQIVYHGLSAATDLALDGAALTSYANQAAIPAGQSGVVWDAQTKLLTAFIASRALSSAFKVAEM
jgi:alpha-D-xyloside xylohydrolase